MCVTVRESELDTIIRQEPHRACVFSFVHMHAFTCKEQYHECVCPSMRVGVKLHAISNIMYLCMRVSMYVCVAMTHRYHLTG